MVRLTHLTAVLASVILTIVVARPPPYQWKFADPEMGPYTEGDILDNLPRDTRQGLTDDYYRWPNALLFYTVSSDFDENQQNLIEEALGEISSKTCIRFQKRVDEVDYVRVMKPASGCSSHVGRQGGPQDLNVADSCFEINDANVYGFGKVAHEFIHALGFRHEHTRVDRDDFVTIHVDRIDPDYMSNFDKNEPPAYDVFNVTYDYGSVMHYPKLSFPKEGETRDTIEVHPDENGEIPNIGQRKGLSPTDFAKLNNMYKC